jgi:hypothetical protein
MECTYPVPLKRVSRLARERQQAEKIKELEAQLLRMASKRQAGTTIRLESPMTGPRYDGAAPATLDSGYLSSPLTSQYRDNTNPAIAPGLADEVQDSVNNDLLHCIQMSAITTNSAVGILSPQSMAGNEESVVAPQHVSASLTNERGL